MGFDLVTPEQLFSAWENGQTLAQLSANYGLSPAVIATSLLSLAGSGCFIPKNILTLVAAAPGAVWPYQLYQQ